MNNIEANNEKINLFIKALGYKTNNERNRDLLTDQKKMVMNVVTDAMNSDNINTIKTALFLIKTSYEVNTDLLLTYISREEELVDASIDIYKGLSDLANGN